MSDGLNKDLEAAVHKAECEVAIIEATTGQTEDYIRGFTDGCQLMKEYFANIVTEDILKHFTVIPLKERR